MNKINLFVMWTSYLLFPFPAVPRLRWNGHNVTGLNSKYIFPIIALLLLHMTALCQNRALIWRLDTSGQIGEITPIIIGEPQLLQENDFTSLSFNGTNTGLILPVNPLEGWKEFTVEILFNPSCGGSSAQRFVHFQDQQGNRGLIELRMAPGGNWCLDTYLHVGETNKGLTLRDDNALHPCNSWYWAALSYDGKTMTHFVNGKEESSGDIDFGPMVPGLISLGVRLNQIYWFDGKIAEIRFHPKPLNVDQLQKRNK